MNPSSVLTHVLQDNMAAEAYKVLRNHVSAENKKIGLDHPNRSLAVFEWEDGKGMIAGACGLIYPGWFSLDLLWVESPTVGKE